MKTSKKKNPRIREYKIIQEDFIDSCRARPHPGNPYRDADMTGKEALIMGAVTLTFLAVMIMIMLLITRAVVKNVINEDQAPAAYTSTETAKEQPKL